MKTDNHGKKRLSPPDSPCLWMQAGVVRFKRCGSEYQCPLCNFDRIMRHAAEENRKIREKGYVPMGKRGRIVGWMEKLKDRPQWKRPCIHHMKQRIDFRACTHEYRCERCEFDQYFYDQYTVHALVRPVDFLNVDGFRIPQGYYLHRGHAWAKIEEGSSVRIGIDDFAMRLLGPLDRVEAPLMGKEMNQNRPGVLLGRAKKRARLLSPVSGVVTDVNPGLRELGSPAGGDPYTDGWVARLHCKNLRAELKKLMFGPETADFYKTESDRLMDLVEEAAGPLAADGGQLSDDIYGKLPELGWRRLTKRFLRN